MEESKMNVAFCSKGLKSQRGKRPWIRDINWRIGSAECSAKANVKGDL